MSDTAVNETCVGCQQAFFDSDKYFKVFLGIGGWWHWHCLMNKLQDEAEHHSRCPVCVVADDPPTGLSGTMEPERCEHELKTDPDAFDAVKVGDKTYEIRFDDRGFKKGDTLVLRKTKYLGIQMYNQEKPLVYVGEPLRRCVTHILRGPIYGLMDGWVIMSIRNKPERCEHRYVRINDAETCMDCGNVPDMGPEWCECIIFKDGIQRINSALTLAAAHGIMYTIEPFQFCPWCGKPLAEEE